MKLIKFNKDDTCYYLVNKACRNLINEDGLLLIAVGISTLLSIFLKSLPFALTSLAGALLVMASLIDIVFPQKSERKKLKKIDSWILKSYYEHV